MRKSARRAAFGLLLVVTGAYAVVQWRGPHGWDALRARHARVAELNAEIHSVKTKNEGLDKQIKDLNKKDRLDLEIRRIDLLPKNEIQFRVDEPKIEAAPPPKVE